VGRKDPCGKFLAPPVWLAMTGLTRGFLIAGDLGAAGRGVIVMGITGIATISAGLLAVGIQVRDGRARGALSE